MRLELDPADLRPEFQTNPGTGDVDQAISTSQVGFEHFKSEVQAAIIAVGRATFYTWQRDSYNAVYPPEVEKRRPSVALPLVEMMPEARRRAELAVAEYGRMCVISEGAFVIYTGEPGAFEIFARVMEGNALRFLFEA